MATFRIIGIDPGGTTGFATYTAQKIINPDGVAEYYDEEWFCTQLEDKHHLSLYELLGMNHVEETIIVCESFEFRQKNRDNVELISKEYIGVVNLFAQERPEVKLKYQTASKGKITPTSFVRKRNLERFGLWNWRTVHAMDAYGHILYYMAFEEKRRDILERGWK